MTPPADTFDESEPVPPQCRATVARIQLALDGETPAGALDADPHAGACAACRDRVGAARALLSALAAPAEPVAVPAGFADRVLVAVLADAWAAPRPTGVRRRVWRGAALAGLAAAVLVAVFVVLPRWDRERNRRPDTFADVRPSIVAPPGPPEVVAPAPREKPPVRIGPEVAKAGQALRETPQPIADSVAAAPKLFGAFAAALRVPDEPAGPMGAALEPARRSLADLPDAARTGLAPVTGTAQKAFDRLLRDVAAVKPKS